MGLAYLNLLGPFSASQLQINCASHNIGRRNTNYTNVSNANRGLKREKNLTLNRWFTDKPTLSHWIHRMVNQRTRRIEG